MDEKHYISVLVNLDKFTRAERSEYLRIINVSAFISPKPTVSPHVYHVIWEGTYSEFLSVTKLQPDLVILLSE